MKWLFSPFLIPKMLLAFAFRPARIHEYVAAEFQKPSSSRFTGYVSPVMLWVILAVIPYFIGVESFLDSLASSGALPWPANSYSSLPVEVRFAAFTVFLVSVPLAYSVVAVIAGRQQITRETLKQPFYEQCSLLQSRSS